MAWTDAARQAAAARKHHTGKGKTAIGKGMTARQKSIMKAAALHLLAPARGTYAAGRAFNKVHQGPDHGAPMTTYARNRMSRNGG